MKCVFFSLFVFFLIFGSSSYAFTLPPCTASNSGSTIFDGQMMQFCNGSGWQTFGQAGNGKGCHWQAWSSKGDNAGNGADPSISGQYVNPTPALPGAPYNTPADLAYCNLKEYVAGMIGGGIAGHNKSDYGGILCCPVGGG